MDNNKCNQMHRFNLKIPSSYMEYLRNAAFAKSTPENRVSVTSYICGLIESDMKRSDSK